MSNQQGIRIEEILRSAEDTQSRASARTEVLRARLPYRFLNQQASLTGPASDLRLAEKTIAGIDSVAMRLLQRYGIDSKSLGERLEVPAATVDEVLAALGPPVALIDLEDGVPPDKLQEARRNAVRLLRNPGRRAGLCFVRPAGVSDPRAARDLVEILVNAGRELPAEDYPLDGIVFPKVRHVHEIEWLFSVLETIESALGLEKGRIRVSLQIETGWGLVNLPALANAALSRLSGIIIGTVDLGADLMLPEVRFRHPINEWARALVVAVAGAAGVPAIDGMNLEFPVGRPDLNAEENRELVLERMRNNFEDTLRSIDYGLSGRWVGHPLQLLATLLAFRRTFTEETIQADVDRLTSFAQLMSGPSAAATDASGTLMDIATDRHLRMLLTRATAWGLLPVEKARALGLIDAREGRPESNDG